MHQQDSQVSELKDPRTYPRRYLGCPLLQAEKDKKLKAELMADLGLIYSNLECTVIVDRAMRVIKGMR